MQEVGGQIEEKIAILKKELALLADLRAAMMMLQPAKAEVVILPVPEDRTLRRDGPRWAIPEEPGTPSILEAAEMFDGDATRAASYITSSADDISAAVGQDTPLEKLEALTQTEEVQQLTRCDIYQYHDY